MWLAGELVFLAAFAGWALLRQFAPDVWNTEKPMDMAFVNAVNRSESFPPHDPWLAGENVNYYYYGHYLARARDQADGHRPGGRVQPRRGAVRALVAGTVFALATTVFLVRRPGAPRTRDHAGSRGRRDRARTG